MVSEKIVASVKSASDQVDVLCQSVKSERIFVNVQSVRITTKYNGSTDSAHSIASVTMRIFS